MSKTRRTKKPTLETVTGWHRRYNEIETLLAEMDSDLNPSLACDLEIEMVSLAEKIASSEI